MIPKKIHYVWLGKKEKPNYIKKCLETWKKHLKDYEIIEWNEDNFDINSHPFVKAAYDAKKYAYASDYIRLHAIYNEGGIYLDTDVLVLDDLTTLLNNDVFVGFENKDYLFAAVFGSIPHHSFIKKLLEYYDKNEFSFDPSDQMKMVNTKIVSEILINDYKCKTNNKEQLLKDGIKVYPDYILCNPSQESKTIHIFTGTWMEGKKSIKTKIATFLKMKLTNKRKAELYRKIIMR